MSEPSQHQPSQSQPSPSQQSPPTDGTHALAYVRPTGRTVFWRRFLPWQVLRFLVINLRMTRMIMRSHDTRLTSRARQG